MIKLFVLFKKSFMIAVVAALSLAALPVVSASASGLGDPADPPAGKTQISDLRLAHIWTRLQRVYERQGGRLERADGIVDRLQNRIDRMAENGKDVTALQAALDAFKAALKDAHPIYESAKGIINAHQGFDAQGKVTDHDMAVETVKELGAKLKEVHRIVGEPGRSLREAIRAYRNANHPEDGPTS
jgi:hypothetical protein